ncbi:MAG: AtzE family amidohydrolase [Synoicihabitans sp.]
MNTMDQPTSAIAASVKDGTTTARKIIDQVLARISATRADLNAFTCVTADRARKRALEIDTAIAANQDPGPLAGVPFSVKNLFDLEGVITLAGSKINWDNPPAGADATAVARLEAAGAICVGALNMGEYAYDFVTENAHYGATHNPHDTSRSAGGSSGGSGAAVAADLSAITLGSDTNGSIRVPSSFCGIWGLRPTYGGLSRGGSFAFVDSLDTIGPFARTVADISLAFDAMAGPDPRDAACCERVLPATFPEIENGTRGLRIAKLGGYFATGGDPTVHAAVEQVAAALNVSSTVELPQVELARTAAYTITAAESGARHLKRLQTRAADFEPNTRDRLLAGALLPATWVDKAQRFRSWWRAEVASVFDSHDVLLAPATPITAPVHGQETLKFRGKELPLRPNIGLFTQPISLIGLPILAAPLHLPEQMPCAVQIIGAPFTETKLLRVGRALEKAGICSAPVAANFAAPA